MSDESSRALLGLLNQQRSNSSNQASNAGGTAAMSNNASNSSGGGGGGILANLLAAMKPGTTGVDSKKASSSSTAADGSAPVKTASTEGLKQLLLAASSTEAAPMNGGGSVQSPIQEIQRYSNIPIASSILHSDSLTNGLRLTPPATQVSLEHANSEMIAKKKMESTIVSQITLPFEYYPGNLISVTKKLIAYSNKGGKIRVINKKNGMKTLLKGHFQQTCDMQFFPSNDTSLLASISLDGSLIVWKILEPTSLDKELQYNILLEIAGDASTINRFKKLAWSNNDKDLLYFVTNQNEIYSLKLSDAASEGSQVTVSSFSFSGVPGFTKLLHQNQPIQDFALSQNGSILAVASKDGLVRIWNAQECRPCISTINVLNSGPVDSIFFAEPSKATSNPTHFITGSCSNTSVEVWNLNSRTRTHALSFEQTGGSASVESVFNLLNFNHENGLLLISCPARSSLYVCHFNETIKSPVAFLDFLIEYPFSQPILSMSFLADEQNGFLFCMHPKSVEYYTENLKSIYDSENMANIPFHSSFIPSRLTSPKSIDTKTTQESDQFLLSPSQSRLLSPASISTGANVAASSSFQNPAKKSSVVNLESSPSAPTAFFDAELIKRNSLEKTEVAAPAVKAPRSGVDVSEIIVKLFNEQNAKLEAERKERESREKEKHESLVRSLAHSINSSLESLVKAELQKSLPTLLERAIDKSVSKATQDYFKSNAASFEKSIQENVAKSIVKLNITEKVSSQVVEASESALLKSFEEKLIPAYQGITQEMFSQVSSTFSVGLKQAMNTLADGTAKKLEVALLKSETNIIREVKAGLADEIKVLNLMGGGGKETDEKMSSSQSREALMEELNTLLSSHAYESAFVKALSCSDLTVVMNLCGKLNPKDIFSARDDGTLPLSPPVVISLVQQLSVDTSTNVDLKLAWLREALFALPTTDPDIVHHVPSVLSQLVRNLEEFCVKNTGTLDQVTASLVRKSRLIVQLAQSLIAGF